MVLAGLLLGSPLFDDDKDRAEAREGASRDGCRRIAREDTPLDVYRHRNGLCVLLMTA